MNVLKNNMFLQSHAFIVISFWLFCSFFNSAYTQNNLQSIIERDRQARVMFYNCENLFDSFDDSLTIDEEFLPFGERYWTYSKYTNKLNKTAQVITAVGGWKPVELVGLCEIENKQVLNDLVYNSQLYLQKYQFIHKESPDKRGIDVALLYQPKSYRPIINKFIKIQFSDSTKTSREILYSKGVLYKTDTIHIFVNHWPSRWGGHLESENYRIEAAQTLRKAVDSIELYTKHPKILIIGDFNDTPSNTSISNHLGAHRNNISSNKSTLINLSKSTNGTIGTHKYNGIWSVLDQIICSSSLLDSTQALYTASNSFTIVDYNFLLEADHKFLGTKPKRTFIGFKHNDGYSDHLPVFIDLFRQ